MEEPVLLEPRSMGGNSVGEEDLSFDQIQELLHRAGARLQDTQVAQQNNVEHVK
jgi:hypothetical protein